MVGAAPTESPQNGLSGQHSESCGAVRRVRSCPGAPRNESSADSGRGSLSNEEASRPACSRSACLLPFAACTSRSRAGAEQQPAGRALGPARGEKAAWPCAGAFSWPSRLCWQQKRWKGMRPVTEKIADRQVRGGRSSPCERKVLGSLAACLPCPLATGSTQQLCQRLGRCPCQGHEGIGHSVVG